MAKFKLGELVMTSQINNDIADSTSFAKDITRALGKYINADFSDMEYDEDIQMNNDAIRNNDERVFATYNTCKGRIYIITEWDRSYTTILYPHEY